MELDKIEIDVLSKLVAERLEDLEHEGENEHFHYSRIGSRAQEEFDLRLLLHKFENELMD